MCLRFGTQILLKTEPQAFCPRVLSLFVSKYTNIFHSSHTEVVHSNLQVCFPQDLLEYFFAHNRELLYSNFLKTRRLNKDIKYYLV